MDKIPSHVIRNKEWILAVNVLLRWSFFLQSASLISSEALWDAGGSRSSGNNVGVKVKHYESKQFEFPICRLRNRVETPIFSPWNICWVRLSNPRRSASLQSKHTWWWSWQSIPPSSWPPNSPTGRQKSLLPVLPTTIFRNKLPLIDNGTQKLICTQINAKQGVRAHRIIVDRQQPEREAARALKRKLFSLIVPRFC